jgi:hypothetical protein
MVVLASLSHPEKRWYRELALALTRGRAFSFFRSVTT